MFEHLMGWENTSEIFEENTFFDDIAGWTESLQGQVSDAIDAELEQAGVDVKQHLILWKGGEALSLSDSANRIHSKYDKFPLREIEIGLLSWLELCEPANYMGSSDEELGELETCTAQWIQAYEREMELRKAERTPHS